MDHEEISMQTGKWKVSIQNRGVKTDFASAHAKNVGDEHNEKKKRFFFRRLLYG